MVLKRLRGGECAMLLKEINRVIFKAFGTPLKSVEGYEN